MKYQSILLITSVVASLALSGCSDDGANGNNASSDVDDSGTLDQGATDMGSDVSGADIGGIEDMTRDQSGIDQGADAGQDQSEDMPPANGQSDYTRCFSDVDCPINGSTCLTLLGLSRTDQNGVSERLLSEIFEELQSGEGVCSASCTSDSSVCDNVLWPDDRGLLVPSICTVVTSGAAPHEVITADPWDIIFDRGEVEAGQAFGSICRPDFSTSISFSPTFCSTCAVAADCGDASTCIDLATGAEAAGDAGTSVCLAACAQDTDCPLGFSCTNDVCMPDSGTCGDCADRDADGYGTGNCGSSTDRITDYDCDDTDPTVYYDVNDLFHSFPDQCGLFDSNCDGEQDDVQQIGTMAYGASHCTSCGDTCSGPVPNGEFRCLPDANNMPQCVPGCAVGSRDCDPNVAGCETSETNPAFLYYEDIDRDGFGDANSVSGQFFCTAAEAAAAMTNPVQSNDDCNDALNTTYPDAVEYCDGVDTNCVVPLDPDDPNVVPAMGQNALGSSCSTGKLGECSAGTEICGVGGQECAQNVSSSAEICDNLDNDCDGTPDNNSPTGNNGTAGDACTVTFAFGTQYDGSINNCLNGTLECSGTPDLDCVSVNAPQDEAPGFDGIDSNCDGHDRYYDAANSRPYAIFASPSFSGGSGTPSAPFGQVESAILAANACTVSTPSGATRKCDVFLSTGGYEGQNPIQIREGVDVYGGFVIPSGGWGQVTNGRNAASTTAPTADKTITTVNVSQPFGSSTSIIGMHAINLTLPTRVQNFTLTTSDVTADGAGNFGMQVLSSSGLELRNFDLRPGAAGDGVDGADGTTYPNAPNTLYHSGAFSTDGYPMLTSATPPWGCAHNNSGRGGAAASARGNRGSNGLPAASGGIGNVGSGSAESADGNGGDAFMTPGVRVPGGLDYAVNPIRIWKAGYGRDGTTNQGGGGGGGSGYASDFYGVVFDFYWGENISGGGGGCAGQGGAGATDGGISTALFVENSAVLVENVVLAPGPGGDGGDGGAGGNGSSGANGGKSDPSNNGDWAYGDPAAYSGHGGHGAGGNGGDGGAAGVSIALWRFGTSASVTGVPTTVRPVLAGAGQAGRRGSAGGTMSGACVEPPTDMSCTKRLAENGFDGEPGADAVYCTDLVDLNFASCSP